MVSFPGKSAIVTGGSSGVGREVVALLVAEGARVTAVARGAAGLERLRREVGGATQTVQGDASDEALAERLVREEAPDLLVLNAGVMPRLAPIDEHTWESFAAPWNTDVKSSFAFGKAALRLPLRPGSTVVIVASGAAVGGSPLSGGYAGAKRMQWFLASYLQEQSDARGLGVRFIAVVPRQLIAGTQIAASASKAYGEAKGMTSEQFMQRFDVPLDARGVAKAIVGALRGDVGPKVTAIGVTGKGTEPLS